MDYSTLKATHVPKTKYESCVATWSGGSCFRTDIAAFGLCFGHDRQLRRGTPLREIRFYRPLGMDGRELARWCVEHATQDAGNGCKRWMYALSGQDGYPTVAALGRRVGGHRLVAWAYHRDADDFLLSSEVVHHKCHNRWCIEPSHLQIVSQSENTAEMIDRRVLVRRIKELEAEVEQLKQARQFAGK